jgi:Right handed beta helix region
VQTSQRAAISLLAGAAAAGLTATATYSPALAADDAPRAVTVARASIVPDCTLFVDAAAPHGGAGTALAPHKTIGAAIEGARSGAVICVAEGVYAEQLSPGAKPLTLAGGFQRGSAFKVRDSAAHVSKAAGHGGSFVGIGDPGPAGDQLTAIDGFEITGYSQAIVRDYWESQRFDLTNNHIHDNVCADQSLAGAGASLVNVSGTIKGNVFRNNSCGRGGALFLNDPLNGNTVSIEQNLIDGNSGTEPDSAHGGALYLYGNTLRIVGNTFIGNSVTQWGGGLYVGAYTEGNQPTTATLAWNVYRGNRAGDSGGGFFCDDGAACIAAHEVYDGNCGGNILLDAGSVGSGPTRATFDHITNVGALEPDCKAPGIGVWVDTYEAAATDQYAFTNSIFWGNGPEMDFATSCATGCEAIKVDVSSSLVQTKYKKDGGITVAFGPGIVESADPQFVAASAGDFRLGQGSPAAGTASDGTDLGAGGGSTAAEKDTAPAKSESQPESVATKNRAGEQALPAVARGEAFMGFPEKFNRYYTDPTWKPSHILYVSPDGGGDGAARETPMAVADAVAAARPGTEIYFLRGAYVGCFEFTKENSGTYDEPVVLYAERNADGSVSVSVACCSEKRKTCFNLEDADYVSIDGFELIGGSYGVRTVGRGFPASEHARGIAVLNCDGHDQEKDPFFSGQSDWAVWEGNVAYGAKEGDGHGIYLSNGSDWNVVRFNETFGNVSSDFQINADPASACAEVGIAFDDTRCDAYAGEGEGGQGASDYFLVEGNYFHDSLGPGPNFTSVRRSVVRNNIFGPQARHNVSFWQETDNPKLGSSDNKVLHNLFVTRDRHAVQFANGSTRNEFANNLLIGISPDDDQPAANPGALLMEVDGTVGDNVYRGNVYVSGYLEGREFNDQEWALTNFSADWFASFPIGLGHDPNVFAPVAGAPFLDLGELIPDALLDRNGVMRQDKVDPGPIEGP